MSEKFSIGAAVNFSYGMMDLKRPADASDDGAMDFQYEDDGTGMGFGFTRVSC